MKLATVLRTATSVVALGGLLTFAVASAQQPQPGQPAAGQAEDAVVAKVNGQEIRRSEVDRVIQGLPPQVQMMPPQMILPAVIDQVINGRLISQQGYKAGLQNEAEVKDRLKRAEERFVQEAYLNREVEKRLTEQRLQEAYKTYLDEHPAEEEVKARHILVESEADAKQVIEDLKKGGDFAKISTEKSKDPGAAQQGGDLGWFTKGQMVEPFANAAFAMKPGELSQAPVQTQFGWHVIKLDDRRKTTPPTLDQVRDELKNELSEKIVSEMVDQLRTQATIERFPIAEAQPPAPAGGQPQQPKP